MNLFHAWYCRSRGWREYLDSLLPSVFEGLDFGDNVLELGPGPGVTTDWLRARVPRLTCLEIERPAAAKLARRLAGTSVTVVRGDATAMQFSGARFSAVVCLTMLHHVPTPALQDRLLAETFRVLRPGGVFAGMDSTPNLRWNLYHALDTRTPVDPATFPQWLQMAGFTLPEVTRYATRFVFRATKPALS